MKQIFFRIAVLSVVAWTALIPSAYVSAAAAAETARRETSTSSVESLAEASFNPVNAFMLKTIPGDYAALEKFFPALKDGGANTVIIEPPRLQQRSLPDMDLYPNIIYLAHQAGLRIFFIFPFRILSAALGEHPDWEDMRYDVTSGTIQPTGTLNLFHQDAVNYLAAAFRELASYSIDGILMGEDFYYGDTEGMTPGMMEEYKKKFNAALVPGRAIAKVGSDDAGKPQVLEYGEGFREWAEIKKERLVEVLQSIMRAARAVNADIKFGIPLHAPGLGDPAEALSRYAYDMEAFRTAKVDFYWIAVPHRDMRESQGYKKSMETLARIAQAATATVKDPCKAIIAVQTTTVSGKVLPLSEIEEATAMVKKSGDACIAYLLDENATLPPAFTRKLFKREETK